MLSLTIAAMFLQAAAPAGLAVDVGQVKLDKLPALERLARPLPTPNMVDAVEKMLATGKCRIPGQTRTRFDFDVPYAVLVEPDGGARRVVVADLGCPELESYTGMVVLEIARRGDFQASKGPKARWYGSTINYNLQ